MKLLNAPGDDPRTYGDTMMIAMGDVCNIMCNSLLANDPLFEDIDRKDLDKYRKKRGRSHKL